MSVLIRPRRSAASCEIAWSPNRFQDTCAGDVEAVYTVRDDGRISPTTGTCRANRGIAAIVRELDTLPPLPQG